MLDIGDHRVAISCADYIFRSAPAEGWYWLRAIPALRLSLTSHQYPHATQNFRFHQQQRITFGFPPNSTRHASPVPLVDLALRIPILKEPIINGLTGVGVEWLRKPVFPTRGRI